MLGIPKSLSPLNVCRLLRLVASALVLLVMVKGLGYRRALALSRSLYKRVALVLFLLSREPSSRLLERELERPRLDHHQLQHQHQAHRDRPLLAYQYSPSPHLPRHRECHHHHQSHHSLPIPSQVPTSPACSLLLHRAIESLFLSMFSLLLKRVQDGMMEGFVPVVIGKARGKQRRFRYPLVDPRRMILRLQRVVTIGLGLLIKSSCSRFQC